MNRFIELTCKSEPCIVFPSAVSMVRSIKGVTVIYFNDNLGSFVEVEETFNEVKTMLYEAVR